MNPMSLFPAIAALTLALTIACFFQKLVGKPSTVGRFISIDGLRGYLAFFVFLHHSAIWYYLLRTDLWRLPPSKVYTHFGQSSFLLFFMITGFLFSTKLLDARKKQISWLRLYVSRVMRLTPLYYLMLLLLFVITAVMSNFTMNEPFWVLIGDGFKWSTFRILGAPDLNGLNYMSLLIGGVTWTLTYEWLFYLSLPAVAVFLRIFSPYILITGATGAVASMLWYNALPNLKEFGSCIAGGFAYGIAAAYIVRWKLFSLLASGAVGSVIALLSIGLAVSAFTTAFSALPLFLLAVTFTIVAGGNTLFGALSNSVARTLGETAYSIYLLHSVILFVAFRFIIGFENAAAFSPLGHWLAVVCCTAVLIPVCFMTFYFIEAPAMRAVPGITAWIERRLTFRSK